MRLINLIFIWWLISLQLPATAGDTRHSEYQETIKIGGTGGAYGVMAQVAAAFQKRHPGVRVYFPPSLGSAGGIKAALAGALDLGLSSRPLSAAELDQGAVAMEYGRSPLLLVTSYRGAEINFMLKEIAYLYSGERKNFADGTPLRLVLRPITETDTSILLGMSPEIADAVRKAHSREGMILALNDLENAETLERVRGSIGWMTLVQLISEKRGLMPVAIENVKPSLENLSSDAYPYYKSYFVVTGAKATPLARTFIEFLNSGEAREILLKNGCLVDQKKP